MRYTPLPLVPTIRSPFGSAASWRAAPTVAIASSLKPPGPVIAGAVGAVPGVDCAFTAPVHPGPGAAASKGPESTVPVDTSICPASTGGSFDDKLVPHADAHPTPTSTYLGIEKRIA